jgi:hypothetical protein
VLANVPRSSVTPQHVQTIIDNVLAAGGSKANAAKAHQLASMFLGSLVKWSLLPRNPAKAVRRSLP